MHLLGGGDKLIRGMPRMSLCDRLLAVFSQILASCKFFGTGKPKRLGFLPGRVIKLHANDCTSVEFKNCDLPQ